MTRDELRQDIKQYISEKRYSHVLGVEEETMSLSDIFSVSSEIKEKLGIAALLHDITKKFTKEQHLKYASERNILIPEINLKNEKTLHAITGAYFAKEKYPNLCDDTVFNAILYHTTGRFGMSFSEKIVYLADYIEPTRTFEDCVKLRDYFYSNITIRDKYDVLRQTLIKSFDMTIIDLIKQGELIHPDTVSARNSLL